MSAWYIYLPLQGIPKGSILRSTREKESFSRPGIHAGHYQMMPHDLRVEHIHTQMICLTIKTLLTHIDGLGTLT